MQFFSVALCSAIVFVAWCWPPLAYAGGTAAYADIYQRYQSWKFEQEVAAPKVISTIVEEAVDLREGDLVGKLEVPRIGISVMVLQGMEEDTLIAGAGHVPGTPSARRRRQCRDRSAPGHVFPQTGRDPAWRQHSSRNRTPNLRVRCRFDGNCRSRRHSSHGVPSPCGTYADHLLPVLLRRRCTKTVHRARPASVTCRAEALDRPG